MTRASEGGHFYDRDGTPQYDVPRSDGKGMRPATLRDARKFGWYPGCTSIIKCAAAPQLVDWMIDQAILAALTLPRVEGESNDALLERIRADAQEQASKAAADGTKVHAAVQGHYEGKQPDEAMWDHVKGITETLTIYFGEQPWVAEAPVAHPLGFGTKSDLHSPAAILDFKGKDFTKADLPKLKCWESHWMQLAATKEALVRKWPELFSTPCGIVYFSRTVPGLAKVCMLDDEELGRGFSMFEGLLAYWKAAKNYYPELWKPEQAAA